MGFIKPRESDASRETRDRSVDRERTIVIVKRAEEDAQHYLEEQAVEQGMKDTGRGRLTLDPDGVVIDKYLEKAAGPLKGLTAAERTVYWAAFIAECQHAGYPRKRDA